MFKAYRAKGAPIGFAPDPRTAHECGDSRYLAIPFFDACLAQRLPARDAKDQKLRPMDMKSAWLADVRSDKAEAATTGMVQSQVTRRKASQGLDGRGCQRFAQHLAKRGRAATKAELQGGVPSAENSVAHYFQQRGIP
jgi:hypothetical protein